MACRPADASDAGAQGEPSDVKMGDPVRLVCRHGERTAGVEGRVSGFYRRHDREDVWVVFVDGTDTIPIESLALVSVPELSKPETTKMA